MHTRKNPQGTLIPLDTELEKNLRSRRRGQGQPPQEEIQNIVEGLEGAGVEQDVPPSPILHEENKVVLEEHIPMAETIRQLSSAPEGGVGFAPSCVIYPAPAVGKTADFELKSGFLHHIPKFHGLSNEDPNKHLKEFQFVCDSMCPANADINILKLKAFPFSLEDKAKSWLFDLPSGHITSWETMVRVFLTKYFPASKITIMRKQITGIQQGVDESFCAYYERFKTLVASCPAHGIKESNLLQYFYEGLLILERQLLDASAGGSFVDKTPELAKELLENRALNYQQYEGVLSSRRVNEVTTNSALEDKVNKMSSLLSQVLNVNNGGGISQVCGVCSTQGHSTDQCPQLASPEGWETLNALGYQGNQGGQRYNPFSNTYNPGLKDHPNFRWSNNDNVLRPPQAPGQMFQRPPGLFMRPQVPQNFVPTSNAPNNSGIPNYDELLKSLAQGQQNLTSATQALVTGQ